MDLFPNCSVAKFSPTLFKYVKNLAKEQLGKISHFLICSKLRKMSSEITLSFHLNSKYSESHYG